eukprot:CAMPEP_0172500180 /NCGR_PEP_ID=MMETSP1066-20121228/135515_1 /TAXON_ID=671091 /ORGANISM="Coscinodiscus wailesii, Strain CCMP2513" /LENGTH=58 /DNA_ID=CAMNT_0013274291 /DNA_START=261 /DNA_END=434 /DNA_ORIENTATION=-
MSHSMMGMVQGHYKPPWALSDFVKEMVLKRSVRGVFVGIGPGILQITPYDGLNFVVLW